MKTNFKFTLPMLAIAAAGAFVSCSDKEDSWYEKGEPDPSKELIDFTGTGEGLSRASLQSRAGGDMISFGGDTKIAMRIKSQKGTASDFRYTVTEMKAEQAGSCTDAMHKAAAGTNSSSGQNPHDHLSYLNADAYRYWDDAFGRDAKLSIYAIAVPQQTNIDLAAKLKGKHETNAPSVSSTNPNWFTETGTSPQRSEDETFVWTVESTNGQTATTIEGQDICYSNNIRMRATDDVAYKGVYRFYDNNGTWTFKEMVAGRMEWTPKTTTSGETVGKFDQGHLIFKHALSKITINLKEAQDDADNKKYYGFNNSSSDDFKFTVSGKNVELLGFPVSNKFDLATGKWSTNSSDITTTTITSLCETTSASTNIQTRTVTGLVVPGKTLDGVSANAMHFVIDDNDYYVTCDQIAKAIQKYYSAGNPGASDPRHDDLDDFKTMEQGDHYVINITVAKTKIESITAQLVDWETVTSADITPSNAYVTVSLEERTGNVTDGNTFNLYRAANTDVLNSSETGNGDFYNGKLHFAWETGYTTATNNDGACNTGDMAKKTWDSTGSKWKTEWFWPDNKTYYHFRSVGNTEGTETTPSDVKIYKQSSTGDYIKITSGTIEGSNYKDYTWGAPFLQKTSGTKFFYNKTKGFDATSLTDANMTGTTQADHQIYKAIGAADPATQKINLMMFHMTSQITVNVTTSTDDSRVDLGEGTTVELLNFYKDGTVLVGNGLVKPTTTAVTTSDAFKNYISEHVSFNGTADPKVAEMAVFRYGVVPQPLAFTHSGTDYTIGLRITTKDGNQYVIKDISGVYAKVTDNNLNNPYTTSQTDSDGNKIYLINEWFPGYKYIYTVKITKTGIQSLTAQLVDWETVTGNIGNITLEGVTPPNP